MTCACAPSRTISSVQLPWSELTMTSIVSPGLADCGQQYALNMTLNLEHGTAELPMRQNK